MAIINLTPQIIQSATCPEGKAKLDLFDQQCRGLMVEIRPTGRKTYYLRYQDDRKKQRQHRIGDARDISLSKAREEAKKLRARITVGEDINAKKHRLRQIPTVAQLIHERYLPFARTYKRSWTTDEGLLRNHVIPRFGDRYLDQVKKADIIDFISAHLLTHKPGSVNRVIILLRYLFNCAKRWEIPGAERNPADFSDRDRSFQIYRDRS